MKAKKLARLRNIIRWVKVAYKDSQLQAKHAAVAYMHYYEHKNTMRDTLRRQDGIETIAQKLLVEMK